MGNKKSLDKANSAKDDEYFTLFEDIAKEIPLYKEQLRGKRIICPCDWDESYNENVVFRKETEVLTSNLFSNGTIREVDIIKSSKRIEKDINIVRCKFIKFLIAHADSYGILSISVSGYNPETQNGVKFQDIDFSKYDLVITNPPFSQFIEFIETMFKNNMQFIVIGPLTALTYKAVFAHIKSNEMWLGYAKQLIGFSRPNGDILLSKNPDGSVPRACKWYTNLDVSYRHDKMILTENYSDSKYPKFYNYNAINVVKTKDIPCDYKYNMGVPVTFIQKYNPQQFEIIGYSGQLAGKMPGSLPKNLKGGPAFYLQNNDGTFKRLFGKMVIRNKKLKK